MTAPTLAAYNPSAPEHVYVKVGTATTITGTGTANMLAQVLDINIRDLNDKEERTWKRLGASPTRSFGKSLYSCEITITLGAQPAMTDYMTATNDASPASIDGDTAIHIQKQVWDDAGALKSTRHVIDCYLAESTDSHSSSNQEGTNTLRFISANRSVVLDNWS